MTDCILCDLVAGRSPASVVYEDSSLLAFLDIQPVTPGHTLIIPKEHVAYLAEFDEATGARLFNVTLRIAQAVRKSGVRCEAVNLFLADGEAAGQDVFHVHMHVIPRYKGDNFIIKPDYSTRPTREELDKLVQRIKSLV